MTTAHFNGYPLRHDRRKRYPFLPVVTLVVTIGVLLGFLVIALWVSGL
jgi:hypothetical protein